MRKPISRSDHTLPANTESVRILVVDDHEENIRVAGALLTELGYDVVPATSAEKALERLEAAPVDLVLLDVLMPGTGGIELCRHLKSEAAYREIPVVFLSAVDNKDLIVQAFDAGGVDYVSKPFNRAELQARVQTHVALKAARDQLVQVARDKDELLGILTHDLKNHLGGIQMTAELLQQRVERVDDSRVHQVVESIAGATTRMLNFVQEFLANMRAEAYFEPSIQPLNLSEFVGRVVKAHQSAADRKEIRLVDETAERSLWVMADPTALNQILDNLLSNAVKFSATGSEVRLSIADGEGSPAGLAVEDGGPGFDEVDFETMFQRYARLSARPTGDEPSTGLGLSIVKKLTDSMNGKIEVTNRTGGGARVAVLFPVRDK